ncbi:hypothetical protein [Tahibacter sp.]|uniref:hypothetical protein n=1 Tax=Tahibacter sp. TaxID=2056211 RepID=UPI0028C378B4|nr:hypothetical protein [Tahibacter sp.]
MGIVCVVAVANRRREAMSAQRGRIARVAVIDRSARLPNPLLRSCVAGKRGSARLPVVAVSDTSQWIHARVPFGRHAVRNGGSMAIIGSSPHAPSPHWCQRTEILDVRDASGVAARRYRVGGEPAHGHSDGTDADKAQACCEEGRGKDRPAQRDKRPRAQARHGEEWCNHARREADRYLA